MEILELKESILEDNNQDANNLREELNQNKTLYVNLMSAPGSGKTTTLLAIIKRLKEKLNIAVMEADIDSDVDAITIANAGVKSIQLHTGGMCHLDADMSRQGLRAIKYQHYDLIFLENIGNLVCPAEYDTGAQLKMEILSVPEGDDKPAKYPLMFEVADLVLINKIDALEVFDFDMDKAKERILKCNPNSKIIAISALTGEGMDEVSDYLYQKVMEVKNNG